MPCKCKGARIMRGVLNSDSVRGAGLRHGQLSRIKSLLALVFKRMRSEGVRNNVRKGVATRARTWLGLGFLDLGL